MRALRPDSGQGAPKPKTNIGKLVASTITSLRGVPNPIGFLVVSIGAFFTCGDAAPRWRLGSFEFSRAREF